MSDIDGMPPDHRQRRGLPRRVLMTADAVGGVWTYALDLARGLSTDGIEVVLAVMGPPPAPAQRRDAARLHNVRLIDWPGRLEWMDEPWDDVAAAGRWLLDVERTHRPDIIHLNGFCHGVLPWRAPCLIVAHSCVRSWWRAVLHETPPPRFDRYTAAVRDGLAAADLVVSPSRAMQACLFDQYGWLPHAMVIPNGRSGPRAPAVVKQPLVLAAGRLWDRAKNLAAVDDVAGRLPWRVLVAGDPGVHACDGPAERLGRLTSAQLARWMRKASIFVAPAHYEPFGLSALEAARAGCALVLGDIASLREIWGEAATFVDPADRDALARAIQALIDDESLRAEMAGRASRRARRFTVARMAGQYATAYAALLAGAQRRGQRLDVAAAPADALAVG